MGLGFIFSFFFRRLFYFFAIFCDGFFLLYIVIKWLVSVYWFFSFFKLRVFGCSFCIFEFKFFRDGFYFWVIFLWEVVFELGVLF